jgi:hypothetical protein
MSNEMCEVVGCNQPAVALVSQTTRGSAGQPAKTIKNYMCDKHAKGIQASNPSATVTRL